MKALTLEQFKESGYNCRLAQEFKGMDFENEYGRAYDDASCYIEKTDTGWYLIIERSEYESQDLAELEAILYRDWYLTEVCS